MKKANLLVALLLAVGASSAAWGQAAAAAPAPAPTPDKIARGLLMKHGERLIFAPCRDRSYINVEDLSTKAAVTAALTDFGLAEGKNLYVEFLGKLDGGLLRVTGINLARLEARCTQVGGPEELWRAVGNKPGWSLVAGDGQVHLKRDGKADLSTAYSEIKSADDTAQIVIADAKGDWRFKRQACLDKTSGILFGWQAELKVGGEVLRGCAWQR